MMTFPLSQLPADAQAFHAKYSGTGLMTFVKCIDGDFFRTAIAKFSEIDTMLSLGWLVINAKA